jgi:uncharacterized protein (TIGR02231 family)
MKTVRIFTTIALAAMMAGATNIASAQDAPVKPVTSRVTAATVFLQGAELTQTASLTLKKGTNEISIEGLSPDIDRGSLRVNIGGGVVVSAHEFSMDYLSSTKAPSARLKMLQDSIDIYQEQIAKVNVDLSINSAMQEYLSTGIEKNVSGSEAGLGIEELKETMEYYQTKSGEILNGARALGERHTELYEALNRVQNQYNEESGASGAKRSGILRLNLSAPSAGTFPATIVYYTSAASWSPYYDINAASIDEPITIAARSRVRQTTGLDWADVRLTLSTSTPSNGRVAPLFSTWFLREQPTPQTSLRIRGVSNAAAQNSVSYEMADMAVAEDLEDVVVVGYGTQRKVSVVGSSVAQAAPAPTIYDYVTTADNALNVTYNIDLPYTIPGNGKEQNIDLATKEAAAEFKYYSAPKIDGATYLIAEIPNWEELDLLSAPANITYDGTYIGETRIDASATDEKLTLTLGTDKRVSVERELAREFNAPRAIGGNTEQTFTYRITVRNSRTEPVMLVLKDQYPTSTDRSIEVTLDERATTPWSVNKSDTGVVTWESTLAAGEVRVYTFSYTVKYSKGLNINL